MALGRRLQKTVGELVYVETAFGRITIAVDVLNAPSTAQRFLENIAAGVYDGAKFYRAVRPDNDRGQPNICIVQGGIDLSCRRSDFGVIRHEPTSETGLSHTAGTVSAVRWEPGTASTEFFIAVDDTPCLDAGGMRTSDRLGFAAFGLVTQGMEVVRSIHELPVRKGSDVEYLEGQEIAVEVPFEVSSATSREGKGRPC